MTVPSPSMPLFSRDGDLVIPTDRARGPWDPNTLHGGPVAALLSWAGERERDGLGDAGQGFQLSRLTADLFKAVPFKPLQIETRTVRRGGRVMVVETTLLAEGDPVSRGTSLFLRVSEAPPTPDNDVEATPHPPSPEESAESGFAPMDMPPSYATMLNARFGDSWQSDGPRVAWFDTNIPLFVGEPPTPAVRAAAISDFVSPLANMSMKAMVAFINADITLYMHRQPVGDWHCLSVAERGHGEGVATASATLRDARGPYGHCSASSIVRPMMEPPA